MLRKLLVASLLALIAAMLLPSPAWAADTECIDFTASNSDSSVEIPTPFDENGHLAEPNANADLGPVVEELSGMASSKTFDDLVWAVGDRGAVKQQTTADGAVNQVPRVWAYDPVNAASEGYVKVDATDLQTTWEPPSSWNEPLPDFEALGINYKAGDDVVFLGDLGNSSFNAKRGTGSANPDQDYWLYKFTEPDVIDTDGSGPDTEIADDTEVNLTGKYKVVFRDTSMNTVFPEVESFFVDEADGDGDAGFVFIEKHSPYRLFASDDSTTIGQGTNFADQVTTLSPGSGEVIIDAAITSNGAWAAWRTGTTIFSVKVLNADDRAVDAIQNNSLCSYSASTSANNVEENFAFRYPGGGSQDGFYWTNDTANNEAAIPTESTNPFIYQADANGTENLP